MSHHVSRRGSLCIFLLLLVLGSTGLLFSCGEPAPVVLGALLPETGPAAPYGRSARQGIEFAVDKINASGGVGGGHMLQVVYRDTKTSGNHAQVGFQELLDQQVKAIVGPGTSTVALSLVPSFGKAGVVLISPSASSPRLSKEGGDWFYRVYPSDVVEGFTMANFCRGRYWTKVAVIASDDTFGQDIAGIFSEKYAAGVRKVVYRQDIPETLTQAQIQDIVNSVKKAAPDAVYIAAYLDQTAELLVALSKLKDKPVMLGTSAVTKEIIKKAGDASENFVFPQVFFDCASDEPEICSFVEEYRTRFGEDPDTFAAHAYDAVGVLQTVMDALTMITPEQIASEMTRVNHKGVTGNIAFDQNGDVVQPPRVFAILGGEIVPFAKFEKAKEGQMIFDK